jgi:N-acetylglutamate synthase-like GNAT family acetyltransferase
MKVRRARTSDAAAIHAIISSYAAAGILLPRALEEVRRHAQRFLVLVDEEASDGSGAPPVCGCVALEPYGTALAEVRSLAVLPTRRGAGLGRRLLTAAIRAAKQQGFERVFAVASSPHFFLRHGFTLSSRHALPEKIARDCCTCPKERTCRLAAVVMPLKSKRSGLSTLAQETETAAI